MMPGVAGGRSSSNSSAGRARPAQPPSRCPAMAAPPPSTCGLAPARTPAGPRSSAPGGRWRAQVPGLASPRAAFAFAFALAPGGLGEVRSSDRSVTQHPHPLQKAPAAFVAPVADQSPESAERGRGPSAAEARGPPVPSLVSLPLRTLEAHSVPCPHAEGVSRGGGKQTLFGTQGWWTFTPDFCTRSPPLVSACGSDFSFPRFPH